MKKLIENYVAFLIILVLIILIGCKKEKNPIVSTNSVSTITATTATSGGTITDEGSSTVISRGVCWSTRTTPSITDSKTNDGAGAGSFSSNIAGLNGATIYYVRAYATNSVGTSYGMTMSFTTLGQSPVPTISEATNITDTSATLNGSVNANYLTTTVTFEYGRTSNYGSTVTATQSPVTGNTNTEVSASITGLIGDITYHYRVNAVNSLGITYTRDMTFRTALSFGTSINGGIVFYYTDKTRQHGLVCAPTDQTQTGLAEWGCAGQAITGAYGMEIGTGSQNTTDIINGCATPGIAARICNDLVLNGYSDWYLPSLAELEEMHINLAKNGLGRFNSGYYWSSSEENDDRALGRSFRSTGTSYSMGKIGLFSVRAIRAF
jgi:hypothetical protein